MELIVIGSGTCVPYRRRGGPATVVKVEDFTILVDCASGTLRRLLDAGIDYSQLDLILFTHFHPDHIGELLPYIFATRYAPGFARKGPSMIMGSEGLTAILDGMRQAFGEWAEPEPGKVRIEEIPRTMDAAFQIPPVTIRTLPLEHTPHSLAYKIEDKDGRSICISGDTDFSPELGRFAKGASCLCLECARPEHGKVKGHLTPSEAGRIAAMAEPGLVVLTHFYPDCDASDMLTPFKKYYKGPVILGEDLMRIPVVW